MAPLNSFTLFPHLPFELRSKIWAHACSIQRFIPITTAHSKPYLLAHYRHFEADDDDDEPFSYLSSAPPPSILHASREARTEALRFYDLAFGTAYTVDVWGPTPPDAPPITITHEPQIFINWAVDRLVILHGVPFRGTMTETDFKTRCEASGLRHLAVNIGHDGRRRVDDYMVHRPPVPGSVRELLVFNETPRVLLDRLGKGMRVVGMEEVSDSTVEFGGEEWRRLKEMEVWKRKFWSKLDERRENGRAVGALEEKPEVKLVRIILA